MKILYVVSREEHKSGFNFSEEGDLASSVPLAVADNLTLARLYAGDLAEVHAKKFAGEVCERREGNREHKYWVKTNLPSADKFMWVVRVVDVLE